MRFALYYMSEYMGMLVMSSMADDLFHGRLDIAAVYYRRSPHSIGSAGDSKLLVKIYLHIFLFYWIRATVPRSGTISLWHWDGRCCCHWHCSI